MFEDIAVTFCCANDSPGGVCHPAQARSPEDKDKLPQAGMLLRITSGTRNP